MLRRLAAAATASLMLAGGLLPAAAPPPHPALARGLALMREGDFEAAVLELDAAVRRIESDPAAARDRAWAYVYLGVAYLELEQEAVARGKFREALARDPGLRLLPAEFSGQSIRVFEGVRTEAAAAVAAAPVPSPAVPSPVAPRAHPGASATPAPEKKGSKGPLVAVLLGGAAAAGAAVALAGGGGGDSGTTTTTTPTGGGSTPPTTTPSTPTTTAPTTTPTSTTTTQPPATTLPSCRYDVGGTVNVLLFGCTGCTCSVTANPNNCGWNARASDTNMITITQGSGTGNGNVVFDVSATLNPRTGRITLDQGGGTCTVNQSTTGVLSGPEEAAGWNALLALEGGAGQITVNGSRVTYQAPGLVQLAAPAGPGRVEALVVTAAGRPGTWRFQLSARAKPSSLRVVAGEVAAITADTVTFRLAGRPGERVVFTFAHR